MRRLLLFLASILLLLGLLAPLAMGLALAPRLEAGLAALAAGLDGVSMVEQRVRRGLFSSAAEFALVNADGERSEHHLRLRHGPWAGWPPALLDARLTSRAEGRPLLSATARVGPGLALDARLEPAPGAGSGSLALTAGLRDGSLRLESDELHLAEALRGLDGELRLGRRAGEGRADLRVAGLAFAGLRLRAGELEGEVLGEDEFGSLRLRLAAGELTPGEGTWRGLEGSLVLRKLHLPTLASAVDALRAIHGAMGPGPEREAALADTLALALPGLLVHQPVLEELALSGAAPTGAFEFQAAARLLAPPPPSFLTDPDRLYGVARIELDAAADAGLARALADRRVAEAWGEVRDPLLREELRRAVLDDLVTRGILERAAGRYGLLIDHRPGSTRVNGRPGALPLAF